MGCGAATGAAYHIQAQDTDAPSKEKRAVEELQESPGEEPQAAAKPAFATLVSHSNRSASDATLTSGSLSAKKLSCSGLPSRGHSDRSSLEDDLSVKRSGSAHAESFFLERSSSSRSPCSTQGLLSGTLATLGEPRATRPSIDYRTLLPERFELDVSRRYILDKLALGEGGFGKVYVAKDTRFADRLVAVKQVAKVGSPEVIKCFYLEIKLMKELDHPNICKLFETFEQDNTIFVVMEYCEGGEVFERVISQGYISERITAAIIAQVSAALRYAHGKKIAHRDMKPENIVFCSKDVQDHRVKVIDWGLGVSFADGKGMRAVVGSTTYAAPEILLHRVGDGRKYTANCDLWSLGVVTYVMLCGKPPFWGSLRQQLTRSLAERFPMSRPPWDVISNEAKDFVKRLLRADPEKRLSIEAVSVHPWVAAHDQQGQTAETENMAGVLTNLHHFRNRSVFHAMCVASVARQLDHKHLRDMHQIFREIDANGDGVLSFEEVSEGFRKIFGEDSREYMEVGETFAQLDLDGSGTVDYTEFCAAGLGKYAGEQEEAIWAAFKAFDIHDTGSITKSDLEKVLATASVRNKWSEEVCTEVVEGVMERFDCDGNGTIEYEEWMQFMRSVWEDHNMPADGDVGGGEEQAESSQPQKLDRLQSGKSISSFRSVPSHLGVQSIKNTYDMLRHVNRLEEIPDEAELEICDFASETG
mmetsp:Transcript_52625/g.118517  ORF Transcript_52625/g.118517 Transcript_52625/m.118517 type:complete len:700 (-) Transcript_52625:225-2324(-)